MFVLEDLLCEALSEDYENCCPPGLIDEIYEKVMDIIRGNDDSTSA